MSSKVPLKEIIKPLVNIIYELKEENGLEIHPIFHLLPPRRDYPDYYQIIEHPISLSTVRKRMTQYKNPQEFINDLARVTWNARVYNTKDSDVYHYAVILDKCVRETIIPSLKKDFPNVRYPYLGPLPDEAPLEGVEIEEPEKQQKALPKPKPMAESPSPVSNSISSKTLPLSSLNETPTKDTLRTGRSLTGLENIPLTRSPGGFRTTEEEYRLAANRKEAENRSSSEDTGTGARKANTLTKIRLSQMSPPIINTSKSSTPTPLANKSHVEKKTHMKRGRPPVIDLPYEQRIKNVLKGMKKEVTPDGKDLIASKFERLPDEEREPQYYSVISDPISLDDIKKKVKQRKYKDFQKFQEDVMLMLNNYRMYHRTQPTELRRAADFETLFNAHCQHELSRPDIDFMTDGELKYPLETVEVNGKSYKIGDWILLRNPNDETKPTVAQIFRLWYTSDGTRWLNCCWYLRPEQTVHRVDRLFYKNEVVKSGQYRDHLVEEIVGKCYVCHFTRFQRGDPDVPIEGPLFVCEYRYNETEKVFNKIRTWKGCLPEEIREIEDPTIPVVGRKFYKYESPIKHLLPPNATVNDPLPQPTEGAVNAPPLVGAVYLRPKLRRDDLGEYSTSDDCPRYIIRPGDPPPPGKYDDETGTVITNQHPGTTVPRGPHRLSSLTRNIQQTPITTRQSRPTQYYPPPVTKGQHPSPPLPLPPHQQMMQKHQQQQQQQLQQHLMLQSQQAGNQVQVKSSGSGSGFAEGSKPIPYRSTAIINDLISQMKAPGAPNANVSVDAPAAAILPIPLTKNIELLQRADYNSQIRRLGKNNVPKRRRAKGEVIWFKGPSVVVSERLINSGTETPLNRWFKKQKVEKSEHEKEGAQATSTEDNEDETEIYPGSFPMGLRPSLEYMAFKLRQQQAQETQVISP